MPDDLDGAVAADADLEDGLGRGPLFLPGDRKTFHAEDSLMLDCDGDVMGMDDCSSLTGFETGTAPWSLVLGEAVP